MKGRIIKFFEDKGFGFIKGENNKEYFFHTSNIIDSKIKPNLNIIVSFDIKKTEKGLAATNINLIKQSDDKYITPNEIYFSKQKNVKEWETLEKGTHFLIGSSSDSPDKAKSILESLISSFGANAGVELQYFKTTGSKPGTGTGTYYFTIHNFKAIPANIGKKSFNGKSKKKIINNFNDFIMHEYDEDIKKTRISAITSLIFFIICASYIGHLFFLDKVYGPSPLYVFIGLFITYILVGRFKDYTFWIESR